MEIHSVAERVFYDYNDVIMSVMASQFTGVLMVYSTVCSGADKRKHQSPVSLAFVRGIHWSPVNSPLKGPVTREMLPFDDAMHHDKNHAVDRRCVLFYYGYVPVDLAISFMKAQ